jgi:hypothetical protein
MRLELTDREDIDEAAITKASQYHLDLVHRIIEMGRDLVSRQRTVLREDDQHRQLQGSPTVADDTPSPG